MGPSMICSLSGIHEVVQRLPRLHHVHRYIEMLIAIPTLGYLRLYK
jgi:hypothetical protein